MKQLTLAEHRARIDNINAAERSCKKYYSRKRIHDYLPGQTIYNLGDYPARFSIAPTDYDRELIADLARNGVELIQIHEEWNDSIRHLGADKFTCHDPKGMEGFIDLCHENGIKIIPYVSTGYFHWHDPDFRDEFIRYDYRLTQSYYDYQHCYAGSPAWREYLLPRTVAVLDRYDFDGIYNDIGRDGSKDYDWAAIAQGAMVEQEYDPELEDLLSAIYGEVKRRGGIYKVHADYNFAPPVKDRVYDYLWIGEGVKNAQIGIGKEHPDYVVPCPDFSRNVEGGLEFHFAKTIPFLQFPLLARGRPRNGKCIDEDITYYGGAFLDFFRRTKEYAETHPNGPHIYSEWSAIPPIANEYPLWCKYLALYKPMVTENSVAYIELRECTDILSPLPDAVYASMFVNEKRYLVVSNFTGSPYELKLSEVWKNRETGVTA
ncbi:MAG: hypothetical protein IKD28_03980, partial [Clostridia bacterium]|nr:hypothetical protein [Clostridia bacterium]